MAVAVDSPPLSAGRSHPTYQEMVVQALTELRESGGSSHRAIASYIADHFSGLPSCHDALLSVHLRRLRSQGLLLMSGYSYLLPGKRGPGRPRKNADLSISAPLKRGPGRPPKNTTPVAASGVKRGPGRPRKNTIPMSVAMPAGKRGRGRPPTNAQMLTASSSGVTQSVALVAIANAPILKRRPGRPPRIALSNNMTSVRWGRGRPPKVPLPAYSSSIPFPALVPGMRKRGRPPKEKRPPGSSPPRKDKPSQSQFVQSVALTTRGPGRPRKERSLGGCHLKAGDEAEPQAANQAGDVPKGGEVWHLPSSGTSTATEKRGRGRPRKRPLEGCEVSLLPSTGTSSTEKRGRGRPRKRSFEGGVVSLLPCSSGTSSTEKRGRGRPRKMPLKTGTTDTGVGALVEKRGPGRPRKKNPSAPLSIVTEGVPMSGCKRGRGRPRKKNPSAPLSIVTDGVPMSGCKRGRGRPRKVNPSAETSAETRIASSMGNNNLSFGTESAVAAIEVSSDLAESKPEKEDTSVSGNKTETGNIILVARMEARPTDAEGALVSGEKVSTAHVEAEGAMLGFDPVISDMDNRSL